MDRKSLLKPATMGTIDHIKMFSYREMEFLSKDRETKSRRTSSRNELTVRFGSKYRDPENIRELMSDKQPLGKAFGIIAVYMFGPNLPTEKSRH